MSQVKLAERKRGDMHVISLQHRVFKRAQKISHMTSRKHCITFRSVPFIDCHIPLFLYSITPFVQQSLLE